MGDLTPEIRGEFKFENDSGAFVHNIYIDSPAMKNGLMAGDLILEVNEKPVADSDELTLIVTSLKPGETARFTVERNGKEETVPVTIGLRDIESRKEKPRLWPGISIVPLTDDIRDQLNLPKNSGSLVIAFVDDPSTGLKSGDVIKTINKKNIKSMKDFYDIVNRENHLAIKILRQGYEMEVEINK